MSNCSDHKSKNRSRRWQTLAGIWLSWLIIAGRGLAVPVTNLSGPLPVKTPSHYVYLTGLAAAQPGHDDELPDPSEGPPSQVAAVRGEVLVRFRPSADRLRQQRVASDLGGKVRYFRRPNQPSRVQQQIASGAGSVFDQLAVVTLPEQADLTHALARLQQHPDVLYAEPNYRLQIAAAPDPVIPNDFDFAQLWGFYNVGQGDGKAGADMGMTEAWRSTTGDKRIVVAIVDTGIDYYHPDLAGNIWSNPKEIAGNGRDDDGNGYVDDLHGYDFVSDDGDPMDDHGHGTHVAGTIGAMGNNGVGVTGVCWEVSLMGIKAFDETGNSELSTAIDGIHYAIANGARIINASWGNNERSQALQDVINEAHQAGILFVGAAGNDNSENIFYPAAYPHVIAVGATDAADHRSRFSNFGAYVDVAAPGENIFSTLPNNSYGFFSGTSMAAPHVSGVAALVLSLHPEFTPNQVENILRNSVTPIIADKPIGTGRIKASAAVRVNAPLPELQLRLPSTISGEIDIAGQASGNDFSNYSLEYGEGTNPTNWVSFFSSPTPVASGTLFQKFSTPALGEGTFTFRLTAQNASGEQAAEQASVQISNVHLTSPADNDIIRAGEKVDIVGTVYGQHRTYQLQYGMGIKPTEWSESGIVLTAEGANQVQEGLLGTWDTSALPPNQFYSLKLTAKAEDGTLREALARLVYLDAHLKPGWPQHLNVRGTFPTEDWRQLTVADIDHDGFDEIILVDHGDMEGDPAHLLVYDHTGSLRWSRELASGAPFADLPVVGDIDGDGLMEIFVDVGSEGKLFAFRSDGTPLPGLWPVHLEASGLGKVLADLEGDGIKELIGYSQNTVTRGGTDFRQLVVFNQHGDLLRSWDVPSCSTELDVPRILPAVGNLDGDPELEIVVVSGCDTVAAYKLSKASGPIWSASTYSTFVSSPVIGDLEGNGTNQVVVAAFDVNGGQRGGIYAFRNDGKRLPGWPVLIEESFTATPALGDLDGDGKPEISIPCWKSGLVHLLRRDGFEVEGWPLAVDNSSLKSSTVLGDVDGDGYADVVLSSPGYMSLVVNNGDLSQAGGVKAWNAHGQPISLSGSAAVPGLLMESFGGTWMKAAPVTLADIDHNGKLDIIAASVQDRSYLPVGEKSLRKNRSSLYVWELDRPYLAARMPWPTFQANAQHTGYLEVSKPPDQPPVLAPMPNQIVAPGSPFFPVNLDQYVDDPDNTPRQLSWTASSQAGLVVTISSNRVAEIKVPNAGWVGTDTIRFSVTDPAGLKAEVGAVFEVRPGYVSPVARPDQVTTLEDTPIEIDVLANDSDPSGHLLTLAGVSKPALGKVTSPDNQTLVYTPKADANGKDSFSYIITNGDGGISMGTVTIEITPVNDPPVAGPDRIVIDEDIPFEIDVLANDTDPDGEVPVLLDFTQPLNGTVVSTPNHLLQYQPTTNFFGTDSFAYIIADSSGATNLGTVSIIVKPVNDPPVAQSQSFVLNRNASQNVTFAATDPDDTEFTFTLVDGPKHGTLWTYPKVATYYPTNGFTGTDIFTYKANDGKDDGPVATVTLLVLDANNPPDAPDQSIVTKVDQPASIHLAATDLDEDPLTYRLLSQPQHGSLTGSDTNYVYQPQPAFKGTDAFTFQAADPKDTSRVATVSIVVTDQNTPPVAESFSLKALINTPTNIALRATDPESNPMSFHVLTRPSNGKLTGKGGTVLYSPNPFFVGSDRFTFKANDGQLDSGVGTVSIMVDPGNHAPVTTNQQVVVPKNMATPLTLDVRDQDGDALSCPILKGPKHGRVSGLGTNLTYLPKPDFVGADSFTYKAWDGQTYSQEATVTLSVSPPSEIQTLAFASIVVLPDGQTRLVLAASALGPVRVEVSTNLVDWTSLSTTTTSSTQGTEVLDPDAHKFPVRYYRARQSSARQ